jgi:uncharacterized protein YecT (DUF1311 family)
MSGIGRQAWRSGMMRILGVPPVTLAAVLLLGPGLGGTARAQSELPFSPAETEACLLRAEGLLREVCVGLSAAACIDSPDGYTTVGMGFCLSREADYWDGRLNAAYRSLRALDEAADAEMARIGSAAPPMAPALLEMQRAWIGFRDAVCGYEVTQWGGGTGQGPAFADCRLRETARQALALEDRLSGKSAQ